MHTTARPIYKPRFYLYHIVTITIEQHPQLLPAQPY